MAARIIWPDARSALAEFARVLDVHGRLVLCFTSRDSLQQKGFARHGLMLYDAGTVQRLLEDNHFHDIHVARQTDRHRSFWCMTALRIAT